MIKIKIWLKSIIVVLGIFGITILMLATSPINAIRMDMLTYGQFQTAMKVTPKVSTSPTGSLRAGGKQYDINPYHFQGDVFEVNSFNVYKILFFYYASPAVDPV
ncbi:MULTISPECIES: hypothetical protein [Lactobacillaceae]|uniref:hypothetical protein n=1 Tax=Lactobacillaceae TaxID=33958 RepID=UPI0014576EC7|nr:hypothetical protein [Lactobacillus sp. HBUAS51381]NLR08960.1 hypothetical protein [Lactobacillus sp. HBUAS51381]